MENLTDLVSQSKSYPLSFTLPLQHQSCHNVNLFQHNPGSPMSFFPQTNDNFEQNKSKAENCDRIISQESQEVRPKKKKRFWLPSEDKIVLDLVDVYGESWTKIASFLNGRTGKQVRERYLNCLNPEIKQRVRWTEKEDNLIKELAVKLKNQWSIISMYLDGRSENHVKNRYYTLCNKPLKTQKKKHKKQAAGNLESSFSQSETKSNDYFLKKEEESGPLTGPFEVSNPSPQIAVKQESEDIKEELGLCELKQDPASNLDKINTEGCLTNQRTSKKKRPWLPHEDELVLSLIQIHGKKWTKISMFLDGRTGKQVRERYLNNLCPNIKRENWTKEEDDLIKRLAVETGNKFSVIATYLVGRSENQVKNRYNSLVNKTERSYKTKHKFIKFMSSLDQFVQSESAHDDIQLKKEEAWGDPFEAIGVMDQAMIKFTKNMRIVIPDMKEVFEDWEAEEELVSYCYENSKQENSFVEDLPYFLYKAEYVKKEEYLKDGENAYEIIYKKVKINEGERVEYDLKQEPF